MPDWCALSLAKRVLSIGCWCAIGTSAILTSPAQALTPQQIFAEDSPSIVVVVAYDANAHPTELGSGVVIARGQVLTNCHVVKNGATLQVRQDKVAYTATLRFADFDRDLCQLSVPKLEAPPVKMGDAKTLKVGASVVAIGAPEGLELTISAGLVSSLRDFGDGTKIIQTSAPISPGSSGGGLFDEQGRLVGITAAQSKEGQNLNFALPVNWIARLPSYPASHQRIQTATVDWLTTAIAIETKEDWHALLAYARRWIQSQPKSAMAWYALGESQHNLEDYRDAERAYLHALKLNPKFGRAWFGLGTTLGQTKKYEDAAMALSQAVKFEPGEKSWRTLGNAYVGWRHYGEAIYAFHNAIKIGASHASTWYFLGKAYYDSRQYERSIGAFKQALKRDNTNAATWNELGNAYGQLRRYAEAEHAFREELKISPSAQAWFNLGMACERQGNRDAALDAYHHLLALDPSMASEYFKMVLHSK